MKSESKKLIIASAAAVIILAALITGTVVILNNNSGNSNQNENSVSGASVVEISLVESSITESSSTESDISESSASGVSGAEVSIADESSTGSSNNDEKKSYKEVKIDGHDDVLYQRLNYNLWSGEFHTDIFDTDKYADSFMEVVSYDEYIKQLEIISAVSLSGEGIRNYYTDENRNYIVLSMSNGNQNCDLELIDVVEEDDKVIIYGDESVDGYMALGNGYFIAIPTDLPAGTKVEYRECYSSEEIHNLEKYGITRNPEMIVADKPVIYLYPEKETDINVKLTDKNRLTCTYPKYVSGWNVTARPDGSLTDIATGRELYSLYYECKNKVDFGTEREGFVVRGEDSASFLEEKLAVLGLSEREAEEFIIYWLPKLEANEYNYIRFAEDDEVNENMPLEITPAPDKIIRVLMVFKGLDSPIKVTEQKLIPQSRTGYTAVEWGGTEIMN